MADAREVDCWTNHAREQLEHEAYIPPGPDKPFFSALIDGLYEVIKQRSHPFPLRVMDFGCGTGLWRLYFDPCFEYVGVDQNEAMIAGAKIRFPDWAYQFMVIKGITDSDLNPYPTQFKVSSFDVIFTSGVLQHNRWSDQPTIIREFNRLLPIGGWYVGYENTYGPDNPGQEHSDDGSRTRESWQGLWESLGFKMVLQTPGKHPFQMYQKVSNVA